MKQPLHTPKKQPVLVRILAVLMTLVVSGTGALSFFTLYAPARWSRFGQTGPLFAEDAQVFGLAVFVIGLLPLIFFARSAKEAGWLGAVIVVAFWAAVFVPLAYR